MASKDYLFVNKDSRSPSLSRNTGTEASLASRVNKHVQQQRFWRSSGPRRSWYRPFVRSDSSSSAPSPIRSETPLLDEGAESINRRVSCDLQSPRLIRRSISSQNSPDSSKQRPRSLPQEQTPSITEEPKPFKGKWPLPAELMTLLRQSGHSADAFMTVVLPLSPLLIEVLQRQVRWAVAASVTDFTVQKGVKMLFSVVLQDKMHAAAFLAMATAQQKRTSNLTFPHDQSPEFFSYRATKLLREHIESHHGSLPTYTFVDIFRLAVCEWLNGNQNAARIHFAYISKSWKEFEPQTAEDYHILEVCSTEDIFLALDVDDAPLLNLNWEPDLSIVPQVPISGPGTNSQREHDNTNARSSISSLHRYISGQSLDKLLREIRSPLAKIIHDCMLDLASFPHFSRIDFGSALNGPTWNMKRRIHATLHRLQSLDLPISLLDDLIRRTIIIILLFASTTPERRVARVEMARLAAKVKVCIENLEAPQKFEDRKPPHVPFKVHLPQDPGLWLWIYIVGLTAAKESPHHETVRLWFTKRALSSIVQNCGLSATSDCLEGVLSDYLYFSTPLARTVEELPADFASRAMWLEGSLSHEARHHRTVEFTD